MTFSDFIAKWNGRGIDFDGYYGDQCMDLMHQYIVEVLGLTDGRILAAAAAKDVYLNFNNIFGREYFQKIDNTPTGVPQKGDIVFWGTGLGPFGHVAMFIDGDVNKFNSFDQNFPINTKCHVQNHNYIGVLGWLRPKVIVPQPVITDQTKIPANLLNSTDFPVTTPMEVQQIRGTLGDFGRTKKELASVKNQLNISNAKRIKAIAELQ